MKMKYALAAVLLSLSGPLFAQNDYNVRQFMSEAGLYFTEPARWNRKDWLTLGGVGAATFEVHQYDTSIQRSAHRHSKNADTFPVQVGEQWGGFFVTPLLGFGLLAQGSVAENVGTKKLGFEIIQSVAYAEAASLVLKTAIGRARPGANKGAGAARSPSFLKSAYNSFPAGHVDAAFSLSTLLAGRVESPVLKALIYIPAGLTLASRIYKNEHWATDCVLGAAIGHFTAVWVMNEHKKKDAKDAADYTLRPYLSGDAVGMLLTVKM